MNLKNYKRILIKIGSAAITGPNGLNEQKIKELTEDFALLLEQKIELIIVSSGAITSARPYFSIKRGDAIHLKQAAAAIGQPLLMNAYQKELEKKQIPMAQILVTHQDLNKKLSYHNLEKCLASLIENKFLAIINENDSVSFDEITFGDNDQLAARIAVMMSADLVIYLTQAEGIFLPDNTVLNETSDIKDLQEIKRLKKTEQGSGGILSKIEAIKKIHEANIDALVTTFNLKNPIQKALKEKRGTWVLAEKTNKKIRDKKIISQSKSNASITIDEGAFKALQKNASLLPSGVTRIMGLFQRGDSILIKHKGKTIAYGISEYSSKECQAIIGKKSGEIKNILGYHLSNVIIHKNYLVLGKTHVSKEKGTKSKRG